MRHHLLIAGTGRSGTSFLVRYLAALGLETHLSRTEAWNDNAQAGLEDSVLHGDDQPYVIKSPWIYEYIDQVVARDDIAIDGVIIPMRDIVEASVSRVTIEMQDAHQKLPFLADETKMWGNHAHTAGGVLFSLNPVDQARLLALGFHDLVHALVKAEIPMSLVAFPRMVQDFDYLYRQLQPMLPPTIDRETARLAFEATADRSKVRTSDELAVRNGDDDAASKFPSAEAIELAALRRELKRLRAELEAKIEAALPATVALSSDLFVFAEEILPGRPLVQRVARSAGLRSVEVKFVTFGRQPDGYAIDWRIIARGRHDDIELGQGAIDTAGMSDWTSVILPLSVIPETSEHAIELHFASPATDDPAAPIGVAFYRPGPDAANPAAMIGDIPAPGGAQIGMVLNYR